MVFSSILFIYYFLAILLVTYFLVPKKFKNSVLLIFSLLFYFYGEKTYIILLISSCLVNYVLGRQISAKNGKLFLIVGLIFNVGLLLFFKYTNFFITNFNSIFNLNISTLNIVLPLGISFFTFQNISYLVDVYRKDVVPQKNFLTYSTYITFFPQLVAGPIVRYKDINDELHNRLENYDIFASGVIRFITGLGKKVIIANTLGSMTVVMLAINEKTVIIYWLIAIMYTMQIYFDFSGYSDMAIGLGKMFGFNFKENFNYPLIAYSITDFWRRWHISLSSFFRDYIYIPLGGNRGTFIKTLRNIFIVWLLTGFWHGASWNFIIWGLYFFIFLMIEKLFLLKYLQNNLWSHLYTVLVIIISFVIFNTTNISDIVIFLKGMLGIGIPFSNFLSLYYFQNAIIIMIIGIVGLTPVMNRLMEKLKKGKYKKFFNVLEIIYYVLIFVITTAYLVSNSFNPFIYFRF